MVMHDLNSGHVVVYGACSEIQESQLGAPSLCGSMQGCSWLDSQHGWFSPCVDLGAQVDGLGGCRQQTDALQSAGSMQCA
jgi:hypothetical protein